MRREPKAGILFDGAPSDEVRDGERGRRVIEERSEGPHDPDWRRIRQQNGAEFIFESRFRYRGQPL